jgi:hypothetical protein
MHQPAGPDHTWCALADALLVHGPRAAFAPCAKANMQSCLPPCRPPTAAGGGSPADRAATQRQQQHHRRLRRRSSNAGHEGCRPGDRQVQDPGAADQARHLGAPHLGWVPASMPARQPSCSSIYRHGHLSSRQNSVGSHNRTRRPVFAVNTLQQHAVPPAARDQGIADGPQHPTSSSARVSQGTSLSTSCSRVLGQHQWTAQQACVAHRTPPPPFSPSCCCCCSCPP